MDCDLSFLRSFDISKGDNIVPPFHLGLQSIIKWPYKSFLTFQVWELWKNDRALELIEDCMQIPSSSFMPLRFIHVGLLCVQESPADRPTMSDVLAMFGNEHIKLVSPKRPAFTGGGSSGSGRDNAEDCSLNDLTASVMDGRWGSIHATWVQLVHQSHFCIHADMSLHEQLLESSASSVRLLFGWHLFKARKLSLNFAECWSIFQKDAVMDFKVTDFE